MSPDILLSNHAVLEPLLNAPVREGLIEAAQGLRFFVLDQLHMCPDRQGAAVALLVRRV